MYIEISGIVVNGEKRGIQLGFPTANMALSPLLNIENGVYAVEVCFDGYRFGGVANVGNHPTVGQSPQKLLEVHLFGFNGNLYGKRLNVRFEEKLRDEKKFDGVEELKNAITEDVEKAKAHFGYYL